MMNVLRQIQRFFNFIIFFCATFFNKSNACREGNKDVGVCLHVYLERDFLSLEKIVYPSKHYYGRYRRSYENGRHRDTVKTKLLSSETDKKRPEKFMLGNYDDRDWIEGPELEDHCNRLKEVLKCFEEVLINCDSGYHFFRYRHLLYALSGAHDFLCFSAHSRKERFLVFLKTIKCAEEARRSEISCHRHNVSSVVWNKILRVEVGDEICDSLSTQRSCLLDHKYIHSHCKDSKRIEVYEDLSNYFLSLWCRYPIHPKLINLTRVNSMGVMSKSDKLQSSYWLYFIIPLSLLLTLGT